MSSPSDVSGSESSTTDPGPSENQSLLQPNLHRNDQQCFCHQRLMSVCLSSKWVLLILVWTLTVSVVYAGLVNIAAGFALASIGIGTFADSNPLTSPFCIIHAVLVFTAMLYPLSGFLADIWCGRFKAIMIGLFCLLPSTIVSIGILVWSLFHQKSFQSITALFSDPEVVPSYIIGVFLSPFILVGLAVYYANFIQFAFDQLMEQSSMQLSLFAHWVIWMEVLGSGIVAVCSSFLGCTNFLPNTNIVILSVPAAILFCFPFVLAFSCWKRHWFIAHPAQHNPYKTVIKVFNFARTHKWPLRRSAFTYCDDEKPTRIDFAKERYGGPFTTEQVEDVKALLRIIGLLLTLGPLLVMDILSSFLGFTIFGQHTGFLEDFTHRCKRWITLDIGTLKYITGVIFLPVYILSHFLFLKQKTNILTRLWIGLFLCFCGVEPFCPCWSQTWLVIFTQSMIKVLVVTVCSPIRGISMEHCCILC